MTGEDFSSQKHRPVRHQGRTWPVIGRQRLGGRTYLILEQLACPPRCRYRAFDTRVREFRMLMRLPATAVSRRQLSVLRRASAANDSVPKIVDHVRIGDEQWLVLTWVYGIDVADYLRRVRAGETPRPSATEVIRLLRGLAHGLRHLHNDCSLIHGDLQPANLILQSRPSRLITVDFGSAWLRESAAESDPGDGISAIYAAPELQVGPAQPDFRSDQFSATVIAYELMTLQIPYAGLGGKAGRPAFTDSVMQSFISPSKLITGKSRLPKSVTSKLNDCMYRALQLQPNDRYATQAAWLGALERVYADINNTGCSEPQTDWLWTIADWCRAWLSRRKE